MQEKSVLVVVAFMGLCLSGALGALGQRSGSIARGKGTLEVVVVDEEGNRLPGARVSLPGRRSTTGRDGSSKFNLLPGRYPIRVSKERYRGRRMNAGVRPGETTTTRVQLQKLPGPAPPQK